MKTFDYFWELVKDHGNVARYHIDECEKVWNTYTLEQQRAIYSNVKNKLRTNKFVPYNPVKAIYENLPYESKQQPSLVLGNEKGLDIVQVYYEGKYRLCTRQTMERFNLQYVKDWKV